MTSSNLRRNSLMVFYLFDYDNLTFFNFKKFIQIAMCECAVKCAPQLRKMKLSNSEQIIKAASCMKSFLKF